MGGRGGGVGSDLGAVGIAACAASTGALGGGAIAPLVSLAATGTGPLDGPLALTLGTGPLAGPLALATGTGPLDDPLALTLGTGPLTAALAFAKGIDPLTGRLTGPLALAAGTAPLAGSRARSCGTAWPEPGAGAATDWPRRDGSGGRRRAPAAQ